MAKLNLGILEYRSSPHGELLLAAPAAPTIVSLALASLGVLHLIDVNVPTVGAAWTAFPAHILHELHGGLFIRTSQWKGLDWGIPLGGAVLDWLLSFHGNYCT